MSLADEVLANHIRDGADCLICMFPWPCVTVRLATQLWAAEQVAAFLFDQSVQLTGNETHVRYVLTLRGFADWLAEYEQRAAVTFPRASTADKEKAR